jgi:DNA-binding response OmpR family regulator
MTATKSKIAIIEDDIAIVQMYRTKFETSGYEVETAGDGVTGLQLVESFHPDIILLDLMMPRMGGLDMLAALRKQPDGKDAKVIVLTNMGDADTAAKINKLDADDYIVKAEMTPKQVEERVSKLLKA